MAMTRRDFVRGGVAAFTRRLRRAVVSHGHRPGAGAIAPQPGRALSERRQRWTQHRDSLRRSQYFARRPNLAIPAASVLQIGTDSAGNRLGLNPRLTDLRSIFNSGRLAIIQRTGYPNSSRSHFQGTDIWSTAIRVAAIHGVAGPLPGSHAGACRSFDRLGHRARDTAHAPREDGRHRGHPQRRRYSFASPNAGADAAAARQSATRIASHVPVDQPHLAFVNSTAQAAFATLDRVAMVASYTPSVAYPNNGFGQALQMVAGAISRGIGTSIYWVQTGGYDTHSGQNTNIANGSYNGLMTTLNGGLFAFYRDMQNQGLLSDTLVIQFSEFGRRISENGSNGTDHGAASLMMAMGGGVRGGIYGTAPNLNPNGNPTLENGNQDVRYETDFRSVYARVIDNWLGGDSTSILGANFQNGPNFI